MSIFSDYSSSSEMHNNLTIDYYLALSSTKGSGITNIISIILQQVSFYCGTGWRASETFMYARAMGWKNVSVYDGGWYEWSSDPKNPVATGERGPDSSK